MKRKKYSAGTPGVNLQGALGAVGPSMEAIGQIGNLINALTSDTTPNLQPVVSQRQTAAYNPYSKDFGNNQLPQFALGGEAQQVPIEVEDNEVMETPQGDITQAQGATHEQGGIDVNVPEGTQIYSDRISIDGKTMASRKASREKSIKRLQKMLAKNPYDKVLKNTLERLTETSQFDDQRDMEIQTIIGKNSKGSAPRQKFADGSPGVTRQRGFDILGLMNTLSSLKNPLSINPQTNYVEDTKNLKIPDGDFTPQQSQQTIDLPVIDSNPPGVDPNSAVSTVGSSLNPLTYKTFSPTFNSNNVLVDNPLSGKLSKMDKFKNFFNKSVQSSKGNDNPANPTTGDLIGMAGNLFGGIAPILNTNSNRAGDRPNINAYKNFGKDALQANDDAKAYVAGQKESNIRELKTSVNASKMSNRNSAMGVNTVRALDSVTDSRYDQGLNKIYNAFAQMMQGNLSEQAQLENVQDATVMQGEQARDLADRQDRDNFNTERGKDLANLGNNIYGAGNAMNTTQTNKEGMQLNNLLSKYGLTYKKVGGEMVLVKNEDIK